MCVPQAGMYAGITGHYQVSKNGAITGSVGMLFDTSGSLALYLQAGAGQGAAPGKGGYVGADIGGFADGLNSDFSGPFATVNGSVADGEGGGAEAFAGTGTHGQLVVGGGINGGIGEGTTSFKGATFTVVSPSVSAATVGPLLTVQGPALVGPILTLLGLAADTVPHC